MVETVKIVVNPADDRQFRAAAESLLSDGADTPQALEAGLRRGYPKARVVVGVRDGFYERWYVYRDGRWVRAAPGAGAGKGTLFA